MQTESLDLDLAPRPEDLRVIHEGLRAYTDGYAGPVNARPFAIFVRDLEFQALSFYGRRGYSIYGVLDGFPPGSRRFHLQKALAQTPGAAT